MDAARRSEDPYEVVTQMRSASLQIGAAPAGGFEAGGFTAPLGPLRAAHVRLARAELDDRGRRSFFVERWATQPIAARSRVVWRGWAQSFAATLRWEQEVGGEPTPRMRGRLDELTALLSGPATRGELRVLEAYEAYFQTLFALGWALVVRADPLSDARRLPGGGGNPGALERAWTLIRQAWIAPWNGRRRHDEILEAVLASIEPPKEIAS